MNLEKLRDQLADAEAEAQRADKAFKVSPDPKTHQSKVISAQLAENAREALAAAEQRARDAERAAKMDQLGKLKGAASVATLFRDCDEDIAAIVKAEQLKVCALDTIVLLRTKQSTLEGEIAWADREGAERDLDTLKQAAAQRGGAS